jgi:hypothetical protein
MIADINPNKVFIMVGTLKESLQENKIKIVDATKITKPITKQT